MDHPGRGRRSRAGLPVAGGTVVRTPAAIWRGRVGSTACAAATPHTNVDPQLIAAALRRARSPPSPARRSGRFNVCPTEPVLAVCDGRTARALRWGLIPPWARKLRAGPEPINARAETLLDKRLFAPLIGDAPTTAASCSPTAGTSGCGPSTRRAQRVPFRYTVDGGALFAFAGLWREGRVGDERIASVTILTTTRERASARPSTTACRRARHRRRPRPRGSSPDVDAAAALELLGVARRRRARRPRPPTPRSTGPASRAPSCSSSPDAAEPVQLQLG